MERISGLDSAIIWLSAFLYDGMADIVCDETFIRIRFNFGTLYILQFCFDTAYKKPGWRVVTHLSSYCYTIDFSETENISVSKPVWLSEVEFPG